MGNMPIVNEQNAIDRMGSAFLEYAFSKEMVFIPHAGNTDFGIDFSVELIDRQRNVTGLTINVQLKSHSSIGFGTNGEYSQKVRASTANYWLASNNPVVMVLVDLSSQTAYGIDAKKAIRKEYSTQDLNRQSWVSLKVKNTDIFGLDVCIKACVEYEKYRVLSQSATDSFTILRFIKYFNENSHWDSFLLVEDCNDYTKEVLSFADKYKIPFSFDQEIINKEEAMEKTLQTVMTDGEIDYFNYYERNRVEFDEAAFDYLSTLTDKICDEIDNDKTSLLKRVLFKFPRLKRLIQENGKPVWNRKWSETASNELNDDYRFDAVDGVLYKTNGD